MNREELEIKESVSNSSKSINGLYAIVISKNVNYSTQHIYEPGQKD